MQNNTWQHIRGIWRAAGDRPVASRGAVEVLRRHFAEDGIVERMARFEAFCERTNALPFVWGKSDCSLLVADWAVENGHDDPAAAWRGKYSTEEQCRALVAERGGLRDVIAACAFSVGLKPLREPAFGAVGVIGSERNPERQWGTIWNGRRWMTWWGDERSARWTPFAAKPLGIWRV